MLDWQWIPVAALLGVSLWMVARRVHGLYRASHDADAPIACGGCKGCSKNAKSPAIVELKPKTKRSI